MLLLLHSSVWFRSEGQTEGKGGRCGGVGVEEEGSLWRRTGRMDGWIARHREEGGKMEGGEGTQDGDKE